MTDTERAARLAEIREYAETGYHYDDDPETIRFLLSELERVEAERAEAVLDRDWATALLHDHRWWTEEVEDPRTGLVLAEHDVCICCWEDRAEGDECGDDHHCELRAFLAGAGLAAARPEQARLRKEADVEHWKGVYANLDAALADAAHWKRVAETHWETIVKDAPLTPTGKLALDAALARVKELEEEIRHWEAGDADELEELERLRAETAAALADVARLREALGKCPQCRGRGKYETDCRYCGDSTYDHNCVTEERDCPTCAPFRAALAATGSCTEQLPGAGPNKLAEPLEQGSDKLGTNTNAAGGKP